jgi:hypothetical protein
LTFCWEVQAVDAAGNISSPSTRWKTIVDNTAPTIPTSLFAEDPSGDLVSSGGITNSQNFAFTLGSSTDTTRYQLKYWNDIIGSPYKELTPWNPSDLSGYSPVLGTYKDNFTQGDGVHYFSFSACDNAGNCSSYSSPFRVTYDNTAPTVTIIDSSTSGNVITPDVSATDASPLTYLWSTAPGVTISNTSAQEPSFTVDVDGTYNFTLTATDTAGNSVIVPFSFTYTTPPAPAPTPTVLGATTSTTPPAPTTAFTNVTTTNNNNETQEVPVTEADQEENTSGEVEGATTNSNFANTADDAVKTAAVVNTNNFLGLGWWWLAIIAAIAGLLWFLLGKDKEENEA